MKDFFENSIVVKVLYLAVWPVFLFLFKKYALPFIENLVYSGVRVDSTYESTSTQQLDNTPESRVTYHCTLTLQQLGSTLSGTYSVKNSYFGGEGDFSSTYKLTGKVKDKYVFLSGTISEKNQIGVIHFLFHVNDGGRTLKGTTTWINRYGEGILLTDDNYIMNRK